MSQENFNKILVQKKFCFESAVLIQKADENGKLH